MRPPRKQVRQRMANYIMSEAVMLRDQADRGRRDAETAEPTAAAVMRRFADQSDERAQMFEDFAEWVKSL